MIIKSANVQTASEGSYSKTVTQSAALVSSNGEKVSAAAMTFTSKEKFDYYEFNQNASRSKRSTQIEQGDDPNGRQAGFLPEDLRGQNGIITTDTGNTGGTSLVMDTAQLKHDLLMRLISSMTGRKYNLRRFTLDSSMMNAMSAVTNGKESFAKSFFASASSSSSMSVSIGFMNNNNGNSILNANGFSMKREESVVETESFSYSAGGVVHTADGQTINFNVNLSMSRKAESHFSQTVNIAQLPVRAIDPLIINYAGTAASLTDMKFDFDLDVDGVKDSISFAGAGSGFLALDKNGDGIINDGSELFGPQSGNGFSELRKYDKDGNGWIDEADEIYSSLRIWSKDANGNDVLYTLKELDVGAIYLNENKTVFGMYDSKGNAQGIMQATSFFLRDSGGAGTISHFDLLA